jgi:hypothetical protein
MNKTIVLADASILKLRDLVNTPKKKLRVSVNTNVRCRSEHMVRPNTSTHTSVMPLTAITRINIYGLTHKESQVFQGINQVFTHNKTVATRTLKLISGKVRT